MTDIKIIPVDKMDKKVAKTLEKILNSQYEEYKEVIDSITGARLFIEQVYGIQTGDGIWERIMSAVVKKDIRAIEKAQ